MMEPGSRVLIPSSYPHCSTNMVSKKLIISDSCLVLGCVLLFWGVYLHIFQNYNKNKTNESTKDSIGQPTLEGSSISLKYELN